MQSNFWQENWFKVGFLVLGFLFLASIFMTRNTGCPVQPLVNEPRLYEDGRTPENPLGI